MAAIEKSDFDNRSIYISPELVSACLVESSLSADDAVSEKSRSLSRKPIRLISAPLSQTTVDDPSVQQDPNAWFSKILKMMQSIFDMMGKISENAATRSELEMKMSDAYRNIQKLMNDEALDQLNKLSEQEKKQKVLNIIFRVIGYLFEAVMAGAMIATGNIAGAIVMFAVFVACDSGLLDKVIDAVCPKDASDGTKLAIKFAVIAVLSIAAGGIAGGIDAGIAAGCSEEAIPALAKFVLKTVLKYTLSNFCETALLSGVASDVSKVFMKMIGDHFGWSKDTIDILTTVVTVLLTIVVAVAAGASVGLMMKNNGVIAESIVGAVERNAANSKFFKLLQLLLQSGIGPKLQYALQTGMALTSCILSLIGAGFTFVKASIQKDQGQTEAMLDMIMQLIQMLNQSIKESNDDLNTTMQSLASNYDRWSVVTDPTAYAARIIG
jgi:hypothetical protein